MYLGFQNVNFKGIKTIYYINVPNKVSIVIVLFSHIGLDIFESPLKKKRRRSLSQSLSPQEHLTQILMNLPTATKLNINNNEDQKRGKSPCGVGLFGNSSPLGPPSSSTTHGTSAGFCNICQKYVSNRTNHKYVHSQVYYNLSTW